MRKRTSALLFLFFFDLALHFGKQERYVVLEVVEVRGRQRKIAGLDALGDDAAGQLEASGAVPDHFFSRSHVPISSPHFQQLFSFFEHFGFAQRLQT